MLAELDSTAREGADGYQDDIQAGQRIVAEHPINRKDVPNHNAIARRANELDGDKRKLDIDAAKYAYGTFLQIVAIEGRAALQTALDDLVDRIARERGKEYHQKFPFSALLLVDCKTDKNTAPKLAVYLRAAAHKGWSFEALCKDLRDNWKLRPSAEAAQDYLADMGKLTRRKKRVSQQKQNKQRHVAAEAETENPRRRSDSTTERGARSVPTASSPKEEKTRPSEDEPRKDSRAIPRSMTITLPRKLPRSRRLYLEFRKETDGSLVEVGWHSFEDLQPREIRNRRRTTSSRSGSTLEKAMKKLRQNTKRVQGKRARAIC